MIGFSSARRALGLLVLALLLSAAPPATAQPASTTLGSSPDSLEATIALGTTRQLALTLVNDGDDTLAARLFEAAAPSAQARRAAPEPALTRVALPAQAERVDPQLQADLAAASDGREDFLVFLADQPDLSAAYQIPGWAERGRFVYRTLRDHADRTQAGLRAALDSRGLRYQPLWIVNALLVRDGSAADVAALAGRAEVALLRAEREVALSGPATQTPLEPDQAADCDADADNVCWNVAKVGASRVWRDFGVRGEGIVVANIDSGVTVGHPALAEQYRGSRGGDSVDHNYSWFDGYGLSSAPVDLHSRSHGTHTMGTMVARGGADGIAPGVGLAPGARWIAARGCVPSLGVSLCQDSALILAAQWMLAPTDLSGRNPRPDLRPHIVNNSWSNSSGGDSMYVGYTTAWRAAGIFPVFVSGNVSSNLYSCGTVRSPGDYAHVVAVGAVGREDWLTDFSAIGPGADGQLKPDLTAPGDGVLSTVSAFGRQYDTLRGTSMAAPHVAGAVALLWSANPTLIGDYDATYQLLSRSALPVSGDPRYEGDAHALCRPTARPNNIYGWGRLDAYAAVADGHVDVPWLRIGGSSVASVGPGDSAEVSIILDARMVPGPGSYQARILVHGADLSAQPLVVPVTLTVPTSPNHATLSGSVTRAADVAPLVATVRVEGGASVQTDAAGRYQLTLPSRRAAYTLVAEATGHVDISVSRVVVAGEQVTQDFVLRLDAAELVLDAAPRTSELSIGETTEVAIPIRNDGTQPLTYTLELLPEPFGVWRSDRPGGPEEGWIEPPANAVDLELSDEGASPALPLGFAFPFYDRQHASVQISANGYLSFKPISVTGTPYVRSCVPLLNLNGAAVAPLRADLDPSAGGRVSYARVAEGFLASWEDVPLGDESGRTLSFQALLRPDGQIRLHYRDLPQLLPADNASAGVQYSLAYAQSLGCESDLELGEGLTVELRPQASAEQWITLGEAGGSLQPGAAGTLSASVRWAPAVGGRPLSGALLLRSNDPLRPQLRLELRLQPADAPFSTYLPLAPAGE